MRDRARDIPMSLLSPQGDSSLDLDRRRKPRGPFFWTAEPWSGRTQAHQLSVTDADPFTGQVAHRLTRNNHQFAGLSHLARLACN